VMSLGTLESLEQTRAAYYERYRFADVFANLKRAPQRLAAKIEAIPGVRQVETRIVKDVTLDIEGLDAPASGRLISMPDHGSPALNNVYLRQGRLLAGGRSNAVLVSEPFAEAHGYHPGDTITASLNGRKRALEIVGIVLSPEYIYSIKAGDMVPDNKHYGIIWMKRQSLAAAYGLEGAFNDIALTLSRDAKVDDVLAQIDKLTAPFGGVGAYGRKDQISHAFLNNEMHGLESTGAVVPPIFLGVAAFLLNMVILRIIETERGQIGLLKAFGYTNWDVGAHYLKFVMIVTIVGVTLGCIGGAWMGRGLTEMYTEFFKFPFLYYQLDTALFAIAIIVSLVAAFLGTIGALRKAIVLPPAEAMQPSPPPVYRKAGFGFSKLFTGFSQPVRMIIRHVTRWPIKSFFTSLGISASVAILVVAFFLEGSIDRLIEIQFDETARQDVAVVFEGAHPRSALAELEKMPGVLKVEPMRSVPARFRFDQKHRRVALSGRLPEGEINRLLDTSLTPMVLPQEGLVISSKLGQMLGAKLGDRIAVEILEGRRPTLTLTVAGIVEEYIGYSAYMNIDALDKVLGDQATVTGGYLLIDPVQEKNLYQELKNTPGIAGVSLRSTVLGSFKKTMAENMLIMITFYIIFATMIAVGVVYNTARISLSERGRELASLRVLGFTRLEVSSILLGELALLTAFALPLGCFLGYGLAWLTVSAFDTELFRLPLWLTAQTYGKAMLIVAFSAVVSGLIVRHQVDRFDLVAVLKMRE
ncbi:MAG: ABC transporter permease, partial [Alphaproteobacteria bacterium]|nr:ABC transporter permease [Alphaproteobacteria bacterium]